MIAHRQPVNLSHMYRLEYKGGLFGSTIYKPKRSVVARICGARYNYRMPHEVIRVEQLSKTYGSGDSAAQALKKVSFSIFHGDFLMITGRNGSGKSTFMHQVAMLDYPTKGRILFNLKKNDADAVNVAALPEKQRIEMRLREIGYIFQEYALIRELTALENVMLPRLMWCSARVAREKALRELSRVGLKKKARHLPSELSGGEQQRVAIARALVNDPHIIFADEPTANLDTVASKNVMETLKKINADGITVVMISHEADELQYAKRQIVFENGVVKAERTPAAGELL